MSFKKLLKQYEITPYRIYTLTGVTQATLSKYVNNVSDPLNMPLSIAHKISTVLGLTLDEFFSKLSE